MYSFDSSLHCPDHVRWKDSLDYSSSVADALVEAYRLIRSDKGQVLAFSHAAMILSPLAGALMSARQRMHVCFILATATAARDEYELALGWLDQSLSLARHLDDIDAQCELFWLRASFNRALLRFVDAIGDSCECLDLLDVQREIQSTEHSDARLHTYARLASYAYFVGQPRLAERSLEEVRRLAAQSSHQRYDVACAEWTQAHLYNIYGQPDRAFSHVLSVYDDYVREATPISRDRFETFLVQVSLSWAGKLPQGTYRDAVLALALPHLETAERLAKQTQDIPGQGLAQLSRIHYQRLTGANARRISSLEAVLRLGTELGDVALLAQAYNTLGDDLVFSDEVESSLNCYRSALRTLEGSQVRVYGTIARRSLLTYQEMTT
jgi:hypothetical protein